MGFGLGLQIEAARVGLGVRARVAARGRVLRAREARLGRLGVQSAHRLAWPGLGCWGWG